MRRYDYVRRSTKRYSIPDFYFAFVLSAINDEPRCVKDAINFEEGKQ